MIARHFEFDYIDFVRLMPYCSGTAFRHVYQCCDRREPWAALQLAQIHIQWAIENGERPGLHGREEIELHRLFFKHIRPLLEDDPIAEILMNIIFYEWGEASKNIRNQLSFYPSEGSA